MATVTELHPASFSEFIQNIEEINSARDTPVWFRGAGKANYKLLPGLYRHPTKKTIGEIAGLERDTMIRFRQRSIPFTDKSLLDDWDALFFMQHHRIPTRLLDWSENPFVAFYFAVMNARFKIVKSKKKFEEDAVVWVLDPVLWNRHALLHQSFDGEILVTKDTELNGYQPTTNFQKMNNHAVAMYGAHNSPRIVAQRGVFTIFGQNLQSMDDAFNEHEFPQDSLKKIVLKKEILSDLRRSILSYGITESVIYPDLDGVAAEMRRHFEFEA